MDEYGMSGMMGGFFSTVAEGLWLFALAAAAVLLIVRGTHPKLGGLRLVGAGMLLWVLTGVIGFTKALLPAYLVYDILGSTLAQAVFGVFNVVGSFVAVVCFAVAFWGAVSVVTSLAGPEQPS